MEPIRQGLLGLILFMSHWLSPESGKAMISAVAIKSARPDTVVVRCRMDIAWNDQLEKIVDAGIPLCFRISSYIGDSDTISFCRTLTCNIVDYTYSFTDSNSAFVKHSQPYPMVLLALQDFCRWDFRISSGVQPVKIEAQILPSRAARLDRVVDMSRIWGRRKVGCDLPVPAINR